MSIHDLNAMRRNQIEEQKDFLNMIYCHFCLAHTDTTAHNERKPIN